VISDGFGQQRATQSNGSFRSARVHRYFHEHSSIRVLGAGIIRATHAFVEFLNRVLGDVESNASLDHDVRS
jgi:hypothetical protein